MEEEGEEEEFHEWESRKVKAKKTREEEAEVVGQED